MHFARLSRRSLSCALMFALAAPLAWAGAAEDTEQAEKEFARGNLVVALTLWRKAADEGNAQAQARLGDMLDKAEENADAVAWYRKSAAQGNANGEYGLGQMYAKGEGVKQDFEQARIHVLRAAEQGHFNAVVQLREAYRVGGLGLSPDPVQSAAWDAKVKALQAAAKANASSVAGTANALGTTNVSNTPNASSR